MTITIEINETQPGTVETKIHGHGRVNAAEKRTAVHLVTALNTAMLTLPQPGKLTGGGFMRETPVPPQNQN